ncbi:MAG: hypothetical protein ABSG41_14385 [Bryobacteraceae bacterium]
MAIATGLARFYNFLANMGLVLRDDPPKVIDMTGRQWGQTVNGLALSIREIPKEDPRQQTVLSVVIRNEGPEPRTFAVPGWLFFYEVHLGVPLTAYGSQLLKPERKTERIEVTLAPGKARETDLPAGILYDMRASGDYRVTVSCRLPDGTVVTSNEIVVRV